jgi:hypothetical protein
MRYVLISKFNGTCYVNIMLLVAYSSLRLFTSKDPRQLAWRCSDKTGPINGFMRDKTCLNCREARQRAGRAAVRQIYWGVKGAVKRGSSKLAWPWHCRGCMGFRTNDSSNNPQILLGQKWSPGPDLLSDVQANCQGSSHQPQQR